MTDEELYTIGIKAYHAELSKKERKGYGPYVKAVIAAVRPIIEAETYEKCAHLCFMLSDVPPETEADKEASRALTSAGNLMRGAAMSVREESRD